MSWTDNYANTQESQAAVSSAWRGEGVLREDVNQPALAQPHPHPVLRQFGVRPIGAYAGIPDTYRPARRRLTD